VTTFGTICSRVRRNIIDLPASVTDAVPTLVNQAIRSLQQQHNFQVMEAKQLFVTTKHSRVLGPKPADFKEFRHRPYIITAMGHAFELGIAPDVLSAEREWGSEQGGEVDPAMIDGEPRVLAMSEPSDDLGTCNLLVYPLPDGGADYADREYRIVVPYWRYLPELDSDTAENWFTRFAELYIEYEATSQGFFLDWDEERGTMWKQKAAEQFRYVKNEDKRARLSQTDSVPISLDVQGPRALRGDLKRR